MKKNKNKEKYQENKIEIWNKRVIIKKWSEQTNKVLDIKKKFKKSVWKKKNFKKTCCFFYVLINWEET